MKREGGARVQGMGEGRGGRDSEGLSSAGFKTSCEERGGGAGLKVWEKAGDAETVRG